MESRQLLAADLLHVGVVYIEEDLGNDAHGDRFLLTFEGGAADSQLTQVTINGDQNIVGFGVGDVFFDTSPAGWGADEAFSFSLDSGIGIDSVQAEVRDGGTQLVLNFVGFHAGESLEFTIDVDEVEDYDPSLSDLEEINDGFDPITSGVEFQGSGFHAQFSAPSYYDVSSSVEFRNRYDPALAESGLPLPADDTDGKRDRTAGAFAQLEQQAIPVELSGYVYHDRSNEGLRGAGEEGLAGVAIRIVPVETVEPQQPVTVFTDADGSYLATGLVPGTYRIVEPNQPDGYFDGLDAAGTIAGLQVGEAVNPGDELRNVVLNGGDSGIEYNFGELLPVALNGNVHLGTDDGDCFGENVQHQPVAGARVLLLDATGLVIDETLSDSNGDYAFQDLKPGEYGILEITPDHLLDGAARSGTVAGRTVGDVISANEIVAIRLNSSEIAEQLDLCEFAPATIAGTVYHDLDVSGRLDPQEPGIDRVVVKLVPIDTVLPIEQLETQTNSAGQYAFHDLPPGQYRIVEIQPDNFLDGIDSAGTVNGQTVGQATNPGDAIEAIRLGGGQAGQDYNFGEYQPVTLRGNVHLTTADGDCFSDDVFHPPVAGARVQLLDATGRPIAETTTDEEGNYAFRDLVPGEYTVVEYTPEGLLDGGAQAGTVEGQPNGVVLDTGRIGQIRLLSGQDGASYDFCEHLPGRLSGHVYHDRNDNGQRETGEEGIGGARVQLIDANQNVVAETTSDADGNYAFDVLEAGRYRIHELQSESWQDGQDTAGTIAGAGNGHAVNPGDTIRDIVLGWGEEGIDYNFGELLDASISGMVHSDVGIRDCVFTPETGDEPLANVQIELLDGDGQVLRTTLTDSQGHYQFSGLRPGTYTVREVQPEGYFDGHQRAGSGGGDDHVVNQISAVPIGSGDQLTDYDFCEDPPVSLSGYVFQDGEPIPLAAGEELPDRTADIRDGVRTPDDTPLAGVQLQLRDGVTGEVIRGESDAVLPGIYSDGPIIVFANAMGYYEFTGLLAGPYAVYQVQPNSYLDGVDTPGTQSGYAFNAGEPVPLWVMQALEVDPQNDAIARILLSPGSNALENNFSEIVVVRTNPPPPPPAFPPFPTTPLPPPPTPPVIDNLPVYHPLPLLGEYEPEPYGHVVGSPNVYTWHLSVIDAGQPRGVGISLDTGEPLWFTTSVARAATVKTSVLREGRWMFADPAKNAPDDVFFGLDGGLPFAGDFNGDGRFEIGVFLEGEWFIDINGNRRWDNGDLWARLGNSKDKPVTGDWDGDGKWDIGIFGPMWPGDPRAVAAEPGLPDSENRPTGEPKNIPPDTKDATDGRRVLKLTSQGTMRADVIDHVFHYGLPGDVPVVGDWNGDGIHTIGIFRAGRWHLDVDGNGRWSDADRVVEFGQDGDQPIAGDFNGDGVDEVGYFRDGQITLDTNGNGRADASDQVMRSMGQTGDQAVVGDWDGDGTDEVAVYRNGESPPPMKKAS